MTSLRLEISTPSGGAFQIVLDPGEVVVGRSATCAVRLPYPSVSSRHLRLAPHNGGWQVTDLGSKNGTTLNGRSLIARDAVDLADGAVLQVGDVSITAAFDEGSTDGFTLTETGTMLRKLVAESATETSAYLKTSTGARIEVPDFAANLRPSETAPFLVDRRGHGFWLTPLASVTVDGEAVGEAGVALDDGSRIETADEKWTFRDPLQELVAKLDEEAAEPQTVRHVPVPATRPVDRVLLLVGVATVVLSVVALLVVFEVV